MIESGDMAMNLIEAQLLCLDEGHPSALDFDHTQVVSMMKHIPRLPGADQPLGKAPIGADKRGTAG